MVTTPAGSMSYSKVTGLDYYKERDQNVMMFGVSEREDEEMEAIVGDIFSSMAWGRSKILLTAYEWERRAWARNLVP